MKHAITTGGAALAAAAMLLAGAGAAQAATTRVDDAQGDVWKQSSGPQRTHWDAAGSTLNGDLDKTDVDHGVDTLTLTTTFKRLKSEKVFFYPYLIVKTDAGDQYGAAAFAGPRMWAGEHEFFDMQDTAGRVKPTFRGDPVPEGPCDAMTHDISYADDTLTLTVPRSCLGDPEWVKVKSLVLSARNNNNDVWWVDNGHNNKHNFRGWSEQVDAEQPPVS